MVAPVEITINIDHITIIIGGQNMTDQQTLDDLTTEVNSTDTVEASAITFIAGLEAQITAAGTDGAKLQALTAQLAARRSALAAAIANTPATPTVPATTTPPAAPPAASSDGSTPPATT